MGSRSRQEPKGIRLDQKIKNLAGKVVQSLGDEPTGKNEDGSPTFPELTLRNVCTGALLQDDIVIDPRTRMPVVVPTESKEKFQCFRLAQKLYDAGDRVELTAKETELLKDQIAKHSAKMVMGRAWIMLDPAEASETE